MGKHDACCPVSLTRRGSGGGDCPHFTDGKLRQRTRDLAGSLGGGTECSLECTPRGASGDTHPVSTSNLRPPCPPPPARVSAGAGGPPADGRAGRSHGRGLAPGEPAGRPPALPVPGLAGLRGRAQLLRVAGQPKLARGPAARRMKVHRPPRTPAAADQMLSGVAARVLLWPPGLRVCLGLGPGGHRRLQRCPRPSLCARNGVLRFLLRSKCALGTREARSQIKFVSS